MDISKYKGLFLQETGGHISEIEAGLLAIEKDPGDRAALDALFRHYHSIKGMSASMGYTPMMKLAHAEEDLLDRVRSGKVALTGGSVTLLLKCLDSMKSLLARVASDEPLESDEALVEELKAAAEGAARAPKEPEKAAQAKDQPAELKVSSVMKVEGRLFDEFLATVGELFMSLSAFKSLSHEVRSIEFKDGLHMLGKSINSLHGSILSARMLPIEDLTAGLPRLIRDLTRDTGKEVSVTTEGMDISLDRSILESLASPMVHIIRNAVDHGIETAAERHEAGKLSVANIRIKAHARRERVVIEVSDDGRGIDRERLKAKAVAKGLPFERVEKMTDREVLRLVCLPGLSTAEKVTATSGRGVGMDAVKDAVEGLGGSIEIESVEGKGTTIMMELPRTTSITKALLVRAGGEQFLIPISNIERVIEVPSSEVSGAYTIDGDEIPAVPLGELLGVSGPQARNCTLIIVDPGPAISIPGGRRLVALKADDFGDEIDAYIKPLLPPMARLWGASGLTIMGDGRPVFMLDIPQIVSRALSGVA